MKRTPISIDLASVIPQPQQKKQNDSSVKLTVKGITPMINSELAASIIVPPIILQTRTFHIHENKQEIHRYYLDQEDQQGGSACNSEQKM